MFSSIKVGYMYKSIKDAQFIAWSNLGHKYVFINVLEFLACWYKISFILSK